MENRLSLFCDRVIEAGWLACAVTVPLFFNIFSSRVFEPDKLTLLRTIVLLMAAAWVTRLLVRPHAKGFFSGTLRTSPLAIPVLLFTGVYILATALSVAPRISFWGSYVRLQGLVTNLSYLILFFLVVDRLRSREQINRLMSVIIVTSIPISIYGVMQHLKLDPLPWGGDVTFRVTSTMGNAIFLAAYLIMVVPLTLVRLVQAAIAVGRPLPGSKKVRDWLLIAGCGAALGLQLTAIVLTKSRGPWIGLAVGLILLGLLWLVRSGQRKPAVAVGAAFGAIFAFTLLINLPNSPLEPFEKANVYLERLGTIMDMESGTNRVRTLIWFGDGVGKGAAGLITSDPWRAIMGHGPESMYMAYNPYYPPDLAHLEARNATPDRSHNDFLDYLVITGFVGLFAYLLVMVRAFSIGLQRLWKDPGLLEQGLLVGIMGALSAHIVESLFGIAIASTLTYTWLLLGCLAALTLMAREDVVPAADAAAPAALPESRSARRRRNERKGQTKAEVLSRGKAWYRRPASYVLVSYILITATATAEVLFLIAPRDPDPVPLVLSGYVWLLIGVLAASFWVQRPAAARGPLSSQSLVIAVGIGLVAIALPVKLFLGSVIADIYFKKGQTQTTVQRFDQAVAPYLDAIDWEPDQDYYYLFLGQAYLELARTSREEKPPQRLERMKDVLRFRDRSVGQLGRENLFQAALITLKQARDLNPLNTDHSANLGRLYRLWGEISSDPSVRQEKWAQSIDYYRQANSLSPYAAHLRAEWGLVYYFLSDLQTAFNKYQEALSLDRLYSPTYAYLGDLHRASGNEDSALEAYRQALVINQRYQSLLPPQEVALHSTLGEIYFRRGQLQESLDENLKLVQISPKDLAAHKNLAVIYREQGDRRKALDEARVALSLAPPEEKNSIQAFISDTQAASP